MLSILEYSICILFAASATAVLHFFVQFVKFSRADNEVKRILELNKTVDNILKEVGIRTCCFLIVGHPNETYKSIHDTNTDDTPNHKENTLYLGNNEICQQSGDSINNFIGELNFSCRLIILIIRIPIL